MVDIVWPIIVPLLVVFAERADPDIDVVIGWVGAREFRLEGGIRRREATWRNAETHAVENVGKKEIHVLNFELEK
jgi:hypothetical protein